MGPVGIAHYMIAAAFIAVALNHLFIAGRGARTSEHLLFAICSLAAAGSAITLASVYGASDVTAIAAAYKWNLSWAGVWIIALIWFVIAFSEGNAPRRWWAAAATAVFLVGIGVNVFTPGDWIHTAVTEIRETSAWGERIAFPDGPLNRWRYATDLALIVLLGLVVDGSIREWRRGRRRRAVLLGGSIAVFLVAFGFYGLLLDHGYVDPPYPEPLAFLLIALVMSYELAGDVARSAALSLEVKANERRWRTLLENVQLIVVGLDREARVSYVNPYATARLGYAAAELLGQPWIDRLVPEPDRAAVWNDFRHALESGALPHHENRLVARSGDVLQVKWSNAVLRDPAGGVTGTLSIGEDVTARMRAEAQVRQQRDELAHVTRVSAMGELAASLAHELIQPLTVILSNAHAARQFLAALPPDLKEVRESLDDIVAADDRAAEVIRRLRALYRKEEPTLVPLDLETVIGEIVALLRSDAVQRNVRVTVRHGPGAGAVRGDSVQLQQVVLNLLLNAFDAVKDCPAAERRVEVGLDRLGDEARVAVRDHGPGLAPGAFDEVFRPFYTTKPAGLGMGLAISRSIVEAHGGRLWAENNPDRGATFAFALPVHHEQMVPQAVAP